MENQQQDICDFVAALVKDLNYFDSENRDFFDRHFFQIPKNIKLFQRKRSKFLDQQKIEAAGGLPPEPSLADFAVEFSWLRQRSRVICDILKKLRKLSTPNDQLAKSVKYFDDTLKEINDMGSCFVTQPPLVLDNQTEFSIALLMLDPNEELSPDQKAKLENNCSFTIKAFEPTTMYDTGSRKSRKRNKTRTFNDYIRGVPLRVKGGTVKKTEDQIYVLKFNKTNIQVVDPSKAPNYSNFGITKKQRYRLEAALKYDFNGTSLTTRCQSLAFMKSSQSNNQASPLWLVQFWYTFFPLHMCVQKDNKYYVTPEQFELGLGYLFKKLTKCTRAIPKLDLLCLRYRLFDQNGLPSADDKTASICIEMLKKEKENARKGLDFWTFFIKTTEILKLKGGAHQLWEEGFLSYLGKDMAEYLLALCPQQSLCLRFSSSKPGSVTVVYQPDQFDIRSNSLEQFSSERINCISLAECVLYEPRLSSVPFIYNYRGNFIKTKNCLYDFVRKSTEVDKGYVPRSIPVPRIKLKTICLDDVRCEVQRQQQQINLSRLDEQLKYIEDEIKLLEKKKAEVIERKSQQQQKQKQQQQHQQQQQQQQQQTPQQEQPPPRPPPSQKQPQQQRNGTMLFYSQQQQQYGTVQFYNQHQPQPSPSIPSEQQHQQQQSPPQQQQQQYGSLQFYSQQQQYETMQFCNQQQQQQPQPSPLVSSQQQHQQQPQQQKQQQQQQYGSVQYSQRNNNMEMQFYTEQQQHHPE